MLKKLLLPLFFGLTVVVGGAFILSTPAFAEEPEDVVETVCVNPNVSSLPENEKPAVCQDNNTSGTDPLFGPDGILTKFIRMLSFAVGIMAVVGLMIGGIRFITSQGEPQSVANARKMVIYSLVGLVVAALSQAVVIFVLNSL